MTVFTYKARDINGLVVIGTIEDEASEPVKEKLAEQGLIPISVTKGQGSLNSSFDIFKSVGNQELMLFTRQFATLFKAGMDMESLLSTLAKQTRNKYFADTITRIKTDVGNGSSLARAFEQHPKVFTQIYTKMLATGEEAGILDQALSQLASILEKEHTLKTTVKSAMLYPKIVVGVLIIATAVMMTYVIPKFSSFYDHFKADLPLPTKILITASNFATSYWYICFGILGLSIYLFKQWYGTTRGKQIVDTITWRIPVFGPLGKMVANARFAHILGSLYKAGVPITRSLDITSQTIEHAGFAREVRVVKNDVEKGKGIADSMREKQYFSPLIIEATAIGEKSGAIDDLYASVASHYDMEVEFTLKNLTTLLEPFLLFFVFGIITLFCLAIFLPMWNMSQAVMH